MKKQPYVYMTNAKLIKELKKNLHEVEYDGRFLQTKQYRHHRTTTCYKHSVAVAYYSLKLANALMFRYDPKSLVRGALLHDYYLYDWHDKSDAHKRFHGFRHPYAALKNAEGDYQLDEIEKNTILRHMFPLVPIPPKHIEGVYVCIIDKVCCIAEMLRIRRLMDFYKPCFDIKTVNENIGA